jgi:uncharacterized protein
MHQTLNVALEIKALSTREFEGHGSVFGNIDLGGDIVVPGAFKRSLAEHRKSGSLPQMFWMHRADQVPGLWTEMSEDKTGLYVKGELVDTTLGNEMHTLLTRKAVRGLSIGYRPVDTEYDKDGNRLLKEIDLWEVSLVSLAMNPLAKIEAAKARLSASGEYVPTEREFERRLRDAGCSKSVARFIIARVFDDEAGGMPDLHRRDAGEVDDEADLVLKAINGLTDKVSAAVLTR